MPDLREYFYPFIDNPGCQMTYEYWVPALSPTIPAKPYCKSIVYPGITVPDYPTASGAVYFTRKDAFWDGSGYNWSKSYWYCRQRDPSIIEEIVDEGIACTQWGAWGPNYHNFNNITHAHGDTGAEYESVPICTQWRDGPAQFHTLCDYRWFSTCQYIAYYASLHGYDDVIKVNFSHGSCNRTVVPLYPPCNNNPSGYPHRPPYNDSYWEENWYAKGVGKIRGQIMFYEQPHCNGYLTQGIAWSHYLHTYYGG